MTTSHPYSQISQHLLKTQSEAENLKDIAGFYYNQFSANVLRMKHAGIAAVEAELKLLDSSH